MISDTTACTRFILLTTTDLIAKREAGLERMLASVAAQKETNVSVRLLAQNCDAEALGRLRAGLPAFVQADAIPLRVSLSAARNRLLRTLHDRDVAPHTVIAFPDDDCWYSDDFLPGLASFFARHPSADLFVCRFGARPVCWHASGLNIRRGSASRIVRTTSSITMFFRATILPSLAAFDEKLGVGAPFNGGEDTDFAIRAFLNGRDAYVTSAPLVGHPEKSLKTVGKYYRGTALAIAKHAKHNPALFIEFARKMVVGFVLLCRGEVMLRDLAPSLRAVWRSRR